MILILFIHQINLKNLHLKNDLILILFNSFIQLKI